MRGFFIFAIGALLGTVATYGLMTGYKVIDEGISQTYFCDQRAREVDARTSSAKIIQYFLKDRSISEFAALIKAAGLHMQNFDKRGYVAIVVGHSPQTRALEFVAPEGGDISILPLPGGKPCETDQSDKVL